MQYFAFFFCFYLSNDLRLGQKQFDAALKAAVLQQFLLPRQPTQCYSYVGINHWLWGDRRSWQCYQKTTCCIKHRQILDSRICYHQHFLLCKFKAITIPDSLSCFIAKKHVSSTRWHEQLQTDKEVAAYSFKQTWTCWYCIMHPAFHLSGFSGLPQPQRIPLAMQLCQRCLPACPEGKKFQSQLFFPKTSSKYKSNLLIPSGNLIPWNGRLAGLDSRTVCQNDNKTLSR